MTNIIDAAVSKAELSSRTQFKQYFDEQVAKAKKTCDQQTEALIQAWDVVDEESLSTTHMSVIDEEYAVVTRSMIRADEYDRELADVSFEGQNEWETSAVNMACAITGASVLLECRQLITEQMLVVDDSSLSKLIFLPDNTASSSEDCPPPRPKKNFPLRPALPRPVAEEEEKEDSGDRSSKWFPGAEIEESSEGEYDDEDDDDEEEVDPNDSIYATGKPREFEEDGEPAYALAFPYHRPDGTRRRSRQRSSRSGDQSDEQPQENPYNVPKVEPVAQAQETYGSLISSPKYPAVIGQQASGSVPWFHGGISRDGAEDIMRYFGTQNPNTCCYLLRKSSSSPKDYVLSLINVSNNNAAIMHLIVVAMTGKDGTTTYATEIKGTMTPVFATLDDMIAYFKSPIVQLAVGVPEIAIPSMDAKAKEGGYVARTKKVNSDIYSTPANIPDPSLDPAVAGAYRQPKSGTVAEEPPLPPKPARKSTETSAADYTIPSNAPALNRRHKPQQDGTGSSRPPSGVAEAHNGYNSDNVTPVQQQAPPQPPRSQQPPPQPPRTQQQAPPQPVRSQQQPTQYQQPQQRGAVPQPITAQVVGKDATLKYQMEQEKLRQQRNAGANPAFTQSGSVHQQQPPTLRAAQGTVAQASDAQQAGHPQSQIAHVSSVRATPKSAKSYQHVDIQQQQQLLKQKQHLQQQMQIQSQQAQQFSQQPLLPQPVARPGQEAPKKVVYQPSHAAHALMSGPGNPMGPRQMMVQTFVPNQQQQQPQQQQPRSMISKGQIGPNGEIITGTPKDIENVLIIGPEQLICEGYLIKSRGIGQSRRRWFRLTTKKLSYFSKDSEELIASVPLTDIAAVSVVSRTKIRITTKLSFGSTNRTEMLLECPNGRVKRKWLVSLECAIAGKLPEKSPGDLEGQIMVEGYITKVVPLGGANKTRWFRLTDKALAYYREEEGALMASVNTSAITTVGTDGNDSRVFRLITNQRFTVGGNFEVTCRCEHRAVRNKWIVNLRKVIPSDRFQS